jgi:hypothetical protein
MIEFQQRVERECANHLMWNADLLLVFQGGYRAQIPLKFYEYLPTGKPIFAVAQAGALSQLMAQTGEGIWAHEDDPREIGERFLQALALPVQSAVHSQQKLAGRFHYRSLSCQLAKWIRELVERRRGED